MKLKKWLQDCGGGFLAVLLIMIVVPIGLLLLIGSVLYTPIDYVKFKRSEYQKDFPRKYNWLCGTHTDNKIYTIVKQNSLPISYHKLYDDYELSGAFVYKDTVLNFSNPFFFDSDKSKWLFWPHNDKEESDVEDTEDEALQENDSIEDCISLEEAQEFILSKYNEEHPNLNLKNVVYFYEESFVKDLYGDIALNTMMQNKIFTVYRKNELKTAIINYISEN